MKENNFKFRESYAKAIGAMNDKQAGKFIKSLCDYAFNNKPFMATKDKTLTATFTLVKSGVDQDKIDKENGRKGGLKASQKKKKDNPIMVVAEILKRENPIEELLKSVIDELSDSLSTEEKEDCDSVENG